MKTSKVILLVLLTILPALCWSKPAKPKDTPCPTNECICSDSDGKRGQGQNQQAICKQFPSTKLPNAVTSLTINEDIGQLTKSMMTKLGKNIRHLDLSNCQIKSIESGSFDMLPKLETLILSGNEIQRIEKGTFVKNNNLRMLHLDGNKLTGIDQGAFSKLDRITELYLQNNQLTTIPTKIPDSLTKLIISNNKLGPQLDNTDLHQVHKLKELDISNNNIETLSMKFVNDISNVERLHLGDKVLLPRGSARILKHINRLEIEGDKGNVIPLPDSTLTELGEMAMLTSLTIENYEIPSLSFMNKLVKLSTLKLQNIVISGSANLQLIINSNKYLTTINFDYSPQLSANLLSNMHVISNLHHLRSVSLRNSGVKSVNSFHVPNEHFRLDISENPLQCDCAFYWLHGKELSEILHSLEHTTCHTPEQINGESLSDALKDIQCSNKSVRNVPQMDNDDFSNDEETESDMDYPPTDGSQFSDDEQFATDLITAPPQDYTDAVVITTANSFTMTGDNTEPEFTEPPVDDSMTNPPQDEFTQPPDDNIQTTPPQGITTMSSVVDIQTSPQDSTTKELNQNDGAESTTEMVKVSSEEGNKGEGGMHHSTHRPHMHHSTTEKPHKGGHHGKHPVKASSNNTVYIVLGSVILVLVVAGMILIIVYWKLKMGSAKIHSDHYEDPGIPSFQKLQAKEDTSLIRGPKK